jgi:hypothetical protein
MILKRFLPLAAFALASCGHKIVEPTLFSAHVTGTVTSTRGASVGGLKVISMIFTTGCDATGGIQGGDSGLTSQSGSFSIDATGFTSGSKCVGVRVERDRNVVGTASGRVAEFRFSAPFDVQEIDVVIP